MVSIKRSGYTKSGYKQKIKNLVGDKLGRERDPYTGHTLWKVEPLLVPYNSKKDNIVISSDMLKYNSDVEIAKLVIKLYKMNKELYPKNFSSDNKSTIRNMVDKVKFWKKSNIQEEVLSIDDIISMKNSWILGTKNGFYHLDDFVDLDKRKLKPDAKQF